VIANHMSLKFTNVDRWVSPTQCFATFANQIVKLPEKMNVKFHKNCENANKFLKISCVRCNSVKFDFHFLGHS